MTNHCFNCKCYDLTKQVRAGHDGVDKPFKLEKWRKDKYKHEYSLFISGKYIHPSKFFVKNGKLYFMPDIEVKKGEKLVLFDAYQPPPKKRCKKVLQTKCQKN